MKTIKQIMHGSELSVDKRCFFQGVLKFEKEIMSFKWNSRSACESMQH